MKTITIGFSRSSSPWKIGSKVIQEVEKRDFSHAYIRYSCLITGVEVVAQASHGYVNEVSYEIFKRDNIVVEEYELELTRDQFKTILTFIQENKGKDYSNMQLLLIGVKKILHIELTDFENRDMAYICSEFAARLLQILGKLMPEHLDLVTPSDLREIIARLPEAKRIIIRQ